MFRLCCWGEQTSGLCFRSLIEFELKFGSSVRKACTSEKSQVMWEFKGILGLRLAVHCVQRP